MRPRRRMGWAAAVLLPLAATGLALPGAAQDADSPPVGCLHGSPLPTCSSFWLMELQVSDAWYLRELPSGTYRGDGTQYEWNLGHMKNIGDRWAVGGTLSLGSGSDGVFTGARGRVRRWLGPDVSVELEAGVAESNGGGGWYPSLTAPSVGARFNIQDWGSVFVRYDALGEPADARIFFPDAEPVEWGRQDAIRAGVGVGGKATLAVSGALVVAYAVLVALVAGEWT